MTRFPTAAQLVSWAKFAPTVKAKYPLRAIACRWELLDEEFTAPREGAV